MLTAAADDDGDEESLVIESGSAANAGTAINVGGTPPVAAAASLSSSLDEEEEDSLTGLDNLLPSTVAAGWIGLNGGTVTAIKGTAAYLLPGAWMLMPGWDLPLADLEMLLLLFGKLSGDIWNNRMPTM